MKKIGIAITDPDDWTGRALCNAVKHYGMLPVKFSFNNATSNISTAEIHAGKIDLTGLDAVIVRDLGPSTQKDVTFRFDILCQLKELGILVVNSPHAIARAANKYASTYLFQRKSIPTPKTLVTNNPGEALNALSYFRCAVLKPVFGYKGIGVERINNDAAGVKKLDELLERDGMVYLQEFIPNPGRDIRAFVVDKEVVGSIYRVASAGKWINNLSQGGSAEPCMLTHEQEEVSLKAANAIGAVYAGVDIIEGDEPYVLEINGTPSSKGIFDACSIDVTMNIIEYLYNRI